MGYLRPCFPWAWIVSAPVRAYDDHIENRTLETQENKTHRAHGNYGEEKNRAVSVYSEPAFIAMRLEFHVVFQQQSPVSRLQKMMVASQRCAYAPLVHCRE